MTEYICSYPKKYSKLNLTPFIPLTSPTLLLPWSPSLPYSPSFPTCPPLLPTFLHVPPISHPYLGYRMLFSSPLSRLFLSNDLHPFHFSLPTLPLNPPPLPVLSPVPLTPPPLSSPSLLSREIPPPFLSLSLLPHSPSLPPSLPPPFPPLQSPRRGGAPRDALGDGAAGGGGPLRDTQPPRVHAGVRAFG